MEINKGMKDLLINHKKKGASLQRPPLFGILPTWISDILSLIYNYFKPFFDFSQKKIRGKVFQGKHQYLNLNMEIFYV